MQEGTKAYVTIVTRSTLWGHQCKGKQVYMLVGEDNEGDWEELMEGMEENDSGKEEQQEMEISLNAIYGNVGLNTLKVQGNE